MILFSSLSAQILAPLQKREKGLKPLRILPPKNDRFSLMEAAPGYILRPAILNILLLHVTKKTKPQRSKKPNVEGRQKSRKLETTPSAKPTIDLLIRPKVVKLVAKHVSKKEILAIMRELFVALDCTNIELSILLTNDEEIQILNRDFRHLDKATDVLSFPLQEHKMPRKISGPLGDLVISLDTTIRQAKTYGVSVPIELLRLLIHGTLHLLGYDHEGVSKVEAQRMRRKEEKLMQLLEKEFPAHSPRKIKNSRGK